MFGEKLLVGQSNHNIDNKNRLFLPAGTGREKSDIVYLCYDKEIDTYTIYPEKIIQEKFVKLQKMVDEAKSVEELKQYKLMLLEFSLSIMRAAEVDAGGRITVGNEFSQFESVNIIGGGDHLMLKPIVKNKKK